MNHLAHFHLSHGNDGLMIGALLGDHIKGPLIGQWPKPWEQGIYLHRHIDAFTDRHPALAEQRKRFNTEFYRYSSIMLDVIFDHFLSRHWQQFHSTPLSDFSEQTYALLSQQTLPQKAQEHAKRLAHYNQLNCYHGWQAVDATLKRIGQRFKRSNPLAGAGNELLAHYSSLELLFLTFYPELQQMAKKKRQQFDNTKPDIPEPTISE